MTSGRAPANDPTTTTGPSSPAASASGPATAYEPVTVENCGTTTTYEAPPERVVTVNQPTVETLLALGLGDRVVGTSYAGHGQTALREDLVAAYEQIPVLSRLDVAKEPLLSVDPDFIIASFESSFGEEKGLSRQSLSGLGIDTHVLYDTCIERPPTWPAIYAEIETLGRIFGVEDRAADLIAEMQADVQAAEQAAGASAETPRVFVYDSGESAPYTAGGQGLQNLMIETAGGENIFADMDKGFGEATWEEVVERDPEIILINDYEDDSHTSPPLDRKEAFLREFPALAEVSAVRNDRFASISLHHVFLSVINPEAAAKLAEDFGDTP